MQPAQEGILKRCRGFAGLFAALLVTFAAALRHDADTPGASVASVDYAAGFDDLHEAVRQARHDAEAAERNPGDPDVSAAPDKNVLEAMGVGRNATALFLPVTIDGQTWWFLVDTGCGETVVDREVAIQVRMIDREEPVQRWKGVHRTLDATVGKSRFPLKCRALCFDLSHLRRCYDAFPLCGILGMDFLRSHVIRIDLDAGKLSFLRSVPESPGSQHKLSRDADDRPLLKVDMERDHDVWFLVDTGCAGPDAGALKESIFRGLAARKRLTDVRGPMTVMTFYGETTCDLGSLDVFQIGSYEHTGLEFHDDDSVNLLGLGYLSRYVVTFDFLNDRLYLNPGKRYSAAAKASAVYADAR